MGKQQSRKSKKSRSCNGAIYNHDESYLEKVRYRVHTKNILKPVDDEHPVESGDSMDVTLRADGHFLSSSLGSDKKEIGIHNCGGNKQKYFAYCGVCGWSTITAAQTTGLSDSSLPRLDWGRYVDRHSNAKCSVDRAERNIEAWKQNSRLQTLKDDILHASFPVLSNVETSEERNFELVMDAVDQQLLGWSSFPYDEEENKTEDVVEEEKDVEAVTFNKATIEENLKHAYSILQQSSPTSMVNNFGSIASQIEPESTGMPLVDVMLHEHDPHMTKASNILKTGLLPNYTVIDVGVTSSHVINNLAHVSCQFVLENKKGEARSAVEAKLYSGSTADTVAFMGGCYGSSGMTYTNGKQWLMKSKGVRLTIRGKPNRYQEEMDAISELVYHANYVARWKEDNIETSKLTKQEEEGLSRLIKLLKESNIGALVFEPVLSSGERGLSPVYMRHLIDALRKIKVASVEDASLTGFRIIYGELSCGRKCGFIVDYVIGGKLLGRGVLFQSTGKISRLLSVKKSTTPATSWANFTDLQILAKRIIWLQEDSTIKNMERIHHKLRERIYSEYLRTMAAYGSTKFKDEVQIINGLGLLFSIASKMEVGKALYNRLLPRFDLEDKQIDELKVVYKRHGKCSNKCY